MTEENEPTVLEGRSIGATVAEAYGDELTLPVLEALCTQVSSVVPGVLGRGGHGAFTLQSKRRVYAREYVRGGFVRRFNRSAFLCTPWTRLTDTRPFVEFAALQTLHHAGIQVPVPVAAVVVWNPLRCSYHGFLLTEEISGARNLLSLAREMAGDSELQDLVTDGCFQAGVLAREMVRAGIQHRDLHLGNVLIDSAGATYVIDLDNARDVAQGGAEIAAVQWMRARWRRSTMKHRLGDICNPPFERGMAHASYQG